MANHFSYLQNTNAMNFTLSLNQCQPIEKPSGKKQGLYSQKYIPGISDIADINLNGKISFDVTALPDNEIAIEKMIVCRHLAHAWLERRRLNSSFKAYQKFISPERIRAAVCTTDQPTKELEIRAYMENAPSIYLINDQQDWPNFLQQQFDRLEPGKRFYAFINTDIHAMALEGLKGQSQPGLFYRLKFYDPNLTVTARTFETNHIAEITHKTMRDFLRYEHLYAEYNAAYLNVAVYYSPTAKKTSPIQQIHYNEIDSFTLYFLALLGKTDHLKDISKKMMWYRSTLSPEQRQASQSAFMDLLTAQTPFGTPALTIAMQQGHTETTSILIELFFQANLPKPQLLSLLTATNANGTPALYIGMQNGHAATAQALITAFFSTNPSSEESIHFLTANKGDIKHSALYAALERGHAKAADILIQAIFKAKLPLETTLQLLATQNDDGTPALSMAIQMGHTAAMKVLIEAFFKAAPTQEILSHLLAGKNQQRGGLALQTAIFFNQLEAATLLIDAFVKAKFPQAILIDLLTARGANEFSALETALMAKNRAALELLIASLLTAGLSHDQLTNLLTATTQRINSLQ